MKFGAFLYLHVPAGKKKEETKKTKKEKKKNLLDLLKKKKKINKRKKGDRKTAPPYIFSSPKVEEKIPVEAGVRVCAERAYLSRSYVSGSL